MDMLLMLREFSGSTLGELLMTLLDPLKDCLSISFNTPVFRMSPLNSHLVRWLLVLDVPSNT